MLFKVLLVFTLISHLAKSLPQNCRISGFRQDTVTCRGQNFTEVPNDLPTNITKLYLSDTRITTLTTNAFQKYIHIRELHIRKFTQLTTIERGAFGNLNNLRILWIIECLQLATVAGGALGRFQELNTLKITKSGLVEIPDFSMFETKSKEHNGTMYEIDLSSNTIEVIEPGAFKSVKTWLLRLQNVNLKEIKNQAFTGSHIAKLDFENNPNLKIIRELAFDGIKALRSLNLSKTSISVLPTAGLSSVEDLNLEQTPTLRKFPSVLQFPTIKVARLTYAHHCCAFQHPDKQDPQLWKMYEFQETVRKKCEPDKSPTTTTISPITPFNPNNWGEIRKRHALSKSSWGLLESLQNGSQTLASKNSHTNLDGFYPNVPTLKVNDTRTKIVACGKMARPYSEVICTPQPNAFNPCEDVMGYEWLRIVVWFVLLAALLGNLVVFLVLVTGRSKMTVPKFLMCNLSVADFLMGLYLLLLASIDIHSLGEYFNHAVSWQNDGGCQIAGFLTVFASELSIFVLTVITIERWYAISYAIHLTKRLKLRQAAGLMLLGCCYAALMASLPLIGISDYGTVSICLPMEASDLLDKGYICSLLILNGIAFTVICCCYVNMYFKVRQSDTTARSNDATIAKRMAMLVFTNFVCWAPIAFFGLTASAGYPLIDITNSKILLVFFYPLNSCANPFLYAILTKQFRKDVFILLGRYGVCTERANRYKGTYTCSKSMSQSRNNGLLLHTNPRTSELSVISRVSHCHKDGKLTINGNVPRNISITTSGIAPKQSSSARIQALDQNPNSNGAWTSKESKERKLTTVPESNQIVDHFDCETILDVSEGLKDLLECGGGGRVRSASEYVILYPACLKDGKRRPGRISYDKQSSLDTTVSTDTSYLSDSSWRNSVEVDKFSFPDKSNGSSEDWRKLGTSTLDTVSDRREPFYLTGPSTSIYPSSEEEDLDYKQSLL